MPEHSTSFRQLSTLPPTRTGISYTAFPVDRVIQPAVGYGVLSVTPSANLIAFGPSSGPFNVDSIIYTLKNVGGASLDWEASIDSDWVQASPSGGTLAPGESVNVTVSIVDEETNELELGTSESVVLFKNTTNDEGSSERSVFLTINQVVIFEQYDGPFEYPAWFFDDEEFYPDGPIFYKSSKISGSASTKLVPVAADPRDADCSVGSPGSAWAVISSSYSGGYSVRVSDGQPIDSDGNPIDPSTAFGFSVTKKGSPGPYQDFGTGGFTTNGTAGSYGDAIEQSIVNGAVPLFESITKTRGSNSFQISRTSLSTNPDGYWAFTWRWGIWCVPTSVVSSLYDAVRPVDLGKTVVRTGTLAMVQELGAWSSVNREYSGNVSRMRMSLETEASEEGIYLMVSYLVTPSVGEPYEYVVLDNFEATGGTQEFISYFPTIPNAAVQYLSHGFFYTQTISDDFSQLDDGYPYLSLPPSSGWVSGARFLMPPPNCMCWDDFESYPNVKYTSVAGGGYGWVDAGVFTSFNDTRAYDDFSGYDDGQIESIGLGVGWPATGVFVLIVNLRAYDDFESYSDGSILTLDFINYVNTVPMWAVSGRFIS